MMKMTKTLSTFLFLLLWPLCDAFAAKNYGAFFVSVQDRKISVISPAKREKNATIVVKNESFDKIVSEIRVGTKTIERFVLEPSGQKGESFTLTVVFPINETLYYVSVAPPFQEVPLKFSKENYEIP